MGVFLGQSGQYDLQEIMEDADEIRKETGLKRLQIFPDKKLGKIKLEIEEPAPANINKQRTWLIDVSNRLVNALRPRLVHLESN